MNFAAIAAAAVHHEPASQAARINATGHTMFETKMTIGKTIICQSV